MEVVDVKPARKAWVGNFVAPESCIEHFQHPRKIEEVLSVAGLIPNHRNRRYIKPDRQECLRRNPCRYVGGMIGPGTRGRRADQQANSAWRNWGSTTADFLCYRIRVLGTRMIFRLQQAPFSGVRPGARARQTLLHFSGRSLSSQSRKLPCHVG